MLQSETKRFSLNEQYPMRQNYFQNNCSAETYLLAPVQCCFLQTSKDQTFFRRHSIIAPRGSGKGKNRYSYDVLKNAYQVCKFIKSFVQDCRFHTSSKGYF